MSLLDALDLRVPVWQAGLGGGLARAPLAGAVSAAGGMGTVGLLEPGHMKAEIRRARELAGGRPVAANLLMPFVRRAHADAVISAGAAAAVLFYGFDGRLVARLREAGVLVLHQVGTLGQARRALSDGADGLIAQGLQAGGHLLGEQDTHTFLPAALDVAGGRPVLAAGGVFDAAGVRRALDAGAAGVVCGTRFLLTEECSAHPLYKQRVLGAQRTLDTRLFSFGWYARHRVVPNASTERWCSPSTSESGPRGVALFNRATEPLMRRMPLALARLGARTQRVSLPLYSPGPMLAGMPQEAIEVTPLYAGECAREIHSVVTVAQAMAALAAPAG